MLGVDGGQRTADLLDLNLILGIWDFPVQVSVIIDGCLTNPNDIRTTYSYNVHPDVRYVVAFTTLPGFPKSDHLLLPSKGNYGLRRKVVQIARSGTRGTMYDICSGVVKGCKTPYEDAMLREVCKNISQFPGTLRTDGSTPADFLPLPPLPTHYRFDRRDEDPVFSNMFKVAYLPDAFLNSPKGKLFLQRRKRILEDEAQTPAKRRKQDQTVESSIPILCILDHISMNTESTPPVNQSILDQSMINPVVSASIEEKQAPSSSHNDVRLEPHIFERTLVNGDVVYVTRFRGQKVSSDELEDAREALQFWMIDPEWDPSTWEKRRLRGKGKKSKWRRKKKDPKEWDKRLSTYLRSKTDQQLLHDVKGRLARATRGHMTQFEALAQDALRGKGGARLHGELLRKRMHNNIKKKIELRRAERRAEIARATLGVN